MRWRSEIRGDERMVLGWSGGVRQCGESSELVAFGGRSTARERREPRELADVPRVAAG